MIEGNSVHVRATTQYLCEYQIDGLCEYLRTANDRDEEVGCFH